MANGDLDQNRTIGISRRQALARAAAVSAAGVVASLPGMASATSPTDKRLRMFEGKYAIGSAILHGYFAVPRGRTAMDVLVVIPGGTGLDDSVRDTVRRQALAGQVAFAPDLAKTSRLPLASRETMLAEFVGHAPQLKKHVRGNGTVRVVAA